MFYLCLDTTKERDMIRGGSVIGLDFGWVKIKIHVLCCDGMLSGKGV